MARPSALLCAESALTHCSAASLLTALSSLSGTKSPVQHIQSSYFPVSAHQVCWQGLSALQDGDLAETGPPTSMNITMTWLQYLPSCDVTLSRCCGDADLIPTLIQPYYAKHCYSSYYEDVLFACRYTSQHCLPRHRTGIEIQSGCVQGAETEGVVAELSQGVAQR